MGTCEMENIKEDDDELKIKYLPRILSLEEYKQIESLMSLKEKIWFGMQFYCGLRQREVVELKRNEINLHTGVSYIVGSKLARQRIIIIPSLFISLIKEYVDLYEPDNFLFENGTGRKYKDVAHLRELLKKYCRKAGLYNAGDVTHYSLRHSFATHMIESGVPIEILSSLLGHIDVETTMRFYIHLGFKIKHYWVNAVFGKVTDNPIYSRSEVFKYKLRYSLV